MKRGLLESNPLTQFALNTGRWANYARMRRDCRKISRAPLDESALLPVRFIVGCGRSGTTILSTAISTHPQTKFLFDPAHLWECIDTRADLTALHSPPENKRVFFDANDFLLEHKARFDRIIASAGDQRLHTCVVEKSPINACRIGWIDELSPGARYVHIVRNGLAVARSIEQIAIKPTYRVAFRPHYDQWWGEQKIKWPSLAKQGESRGYAPGETSLLTEERQRGAYEWVVSLSEVERSREALGDRLLEITFTQLTSDPKRTLERIADHIGVPNLDGWAKAASAMFRPDRDASSYQLKLPYMLKDSFNKLQSRYGFQGEAGSI